MGAATVTAKISIEAGVLVRGNVKKEIEKAAFKLGLECEVFEDKGLLDSEYIFRVKGPEENVRRLYTGVRSMERSYNSD